MLGAIADGRDYIQQGHEGDTPQGSEHHQPGHFQYLGSKIRMPDVKQPVQR